MIPSLPAIAFHRQVGPHRWGDHELITWFYDFEEYSTCDSWDLKYETRQGMVLVGPDLKCWEIVRVIDRGVFGSIPRRVLRFLLRQSVHRIDQELVEIAPISLDNLKARISASVLANSDYWIDGGDIVGVNGPPREKQDLLDEIVAAVNAAGSVLQLIDALYDLDLSSGTTPLG